jgi:Tol biopolymer transport system component
LLERTGDGLRGFAVQGASWAPDDTIVFTAVNPRVRGLWRIAASGGTPQRLTTVREGELGHSWPQMVPGRHAVLYTIWNNTGFGGGRIVVQPLPGGEPTILVEGGSYGRIVVDGDGRAWLVYARPESLLAAPFDLDRLQLAGQAVPVLSGVLTNLSGGAHFASSPAGVLVYVPGELNETIKTAVWIDRTGKATEIGRIPGLGFQYRLSPDGRRLARPEAVGPSRDLYVENLETQETPARLTFGATTNSPVWTWDGKRIIYAKGAPKANLFWKAADGSGDEERLTTSKNGQIPGSVSRDGKTLAYVEDDPDSGSDIWLLSLGETRAPRLLVGTPGAELYPMISPDGRWLAYKSIMSGKFEIYLVSLSGDGRQHPVSKGGGHNPLWSPDGRELYYRSDIPERRGDMMVVSIDTRGREPKIGTPRLLFQSPYQGEGDIAPDGRFLLLKPTPEESPSRVIQVVFNWFRDLQVRVAAR